MTAVDVSIAIAAGSAFASAVSAYQSARSVALDHRPIVVGDECRELTELYLDSDTPDVGAVGVTLRNEGPGTALNVRYRVRSWTWENIDTDWSHSIGSLAPQEERRDSTVFRVPPGLTAVELGKLDEQELQGEGEPEYVLWFVETQSDQCSADSSSCAR